MQHIKLTFLITLESDYHSGSGHGDGPLVDASLLREFDGRPVLRGTTIVGLLKDAAEKLAALQPVVVQEHEIINAIKRIFGTPIIPKSWRVGSAVTSGSGAGQSERWGSQDVMRVRVNPRTRKSDPQKLFSQEEGQRGLQFKFTAECLYATENDAKDALFLIAASRMLQCLGSGRRRGRGACNVDLISAEGLTFLNKPDLLRSAIQQFSSVWLKNGNINWQDESEHKEEKTNWKTQDIDEANTQVFNCLIYLKEPVVISRRSETANTFQSLPYIPGGILLGTFATRAAKFLEMDNEMSEQTMTEHSDFYKLFVRGDVQCSGLLPANSDKRKNKLYASIPAPLDIFVCEHFPAFQGSAFPGHRKQMFSLINKIPEKCGDVECNAKLVNVGKSFIQLDEVINMVEFEPEFREETHIRINSETGRAEQGDLFEYIAIEAGQYFMGQISFVNIEAMQKFENLTGITLPIEKDEEESEVNNEILLGKATRRGYGKALITVREVAEDTQSPWLQENLEKRVAMNENAAELEICMTLLTDAIFLDKWGRFYQDFKEEWIVNMLNENLKDGQFFSDDIEIINQFARSRGVDSFHGHRRLPRWRDQAIIAGSTVGFKIKHEAISRISESKTWSEGFTALMQSLQSIESQGVGWRCHEGFGRVAFNHVIGREDNEFYCQDYEIPDSGETTAIHPTAYKAGFKQNWKKNLENAELKMDEAPEHYILLARVLFMSRELDFETIKSRLNLLTAPSSIYLWQKKLEVREKDLEAKIKRKHNSFEQIGKLLDELAEKIDTFDESISQDCRRIGLELLSEKIATQAKAVLQRRESV